MPRQQKCEIDAEDVGYVVRLWSAAGTRVTFTIGESDADIEGAGAIVVQFLKNQRATGSCTPPEEE